MVGAACEWLQYLRRQPCNGRVGGSLTLQLPSHHTELSAVAIMACIVLEGTIVLLVQSVTAYNSRARR